MTSLGKNIASFIARDGATIHSNGATDDCEVHVGKMGITWWPQRHTVAWTEGDGDTMKVIVTAAHCDVGQQ